jgi:purine-nucleoside phosphorylase
MASIADDLLEAVSISWNDIPHFPPSRRGDLGRFAIGRLSGIPVVIVQGRIMLYERGRLQDVVFPIRVLGRLGVRSLILTGAAASVNPTFAPGNLVVLSDHINTMGANALVGLQDPKFGPDFIDLSEVYSKHYRNLAIDTARELGFDVREGVYAEHSGPAYETPAETRSLRSQGSDLVGASIVPEAIAACHIGLELLAVCAVTNYATGLITDPSSAEEVVATGMQLQNRLATLVNAVVPKIARARVGMDTKSPPDNRN